MAPRTEQTLQQHNMIAQCKLSSFFLVSCQLLQLFAYHNNTTCGLTEQCSSPKCSHRWLAFCEARVAFSIVKRRIRLSQCAVPAMFSCPHCCATYQVKLKLGKIWQIRTLCKISRSSSSPSLGGWTAAFRSLLAGLIRLCIDLRQIQIYLRKYIAAAWIHPKSGWCWWYITANFFDFPPNFRLSMRN